ncbi:hypothetical protein BDR06DRAFT_968854 [Suillus hirtellus]|nr:hypothetical protein BDR06DRAFT_968854 [Suillus hirtellus]
MILILFQLLTVFWWLIIHNCHGQSNRKCQQVYNVMILTFLSRCRQQATIERDDIIRVLRPLDAATIIALEYSAFLPIQKDRKKWECIESAVDYYLKSPTAVAVEKGAAEISCQGYDGEKLKERILEFILENRLCSDTLMLKQTGMITLSMLVGIAYRMGEQVMYMKVWETAVDLEQINHPRGDHSIMSLSCD